MWICLNDSFVSAVVELGNAEDLLIRARKTQHLSRLFDGHEVLETPNADYAARVRVSKSEFCKVLAKRIYGLSYPNFKNSVMDRGLHELYSEYWSLHRRYQFQRGL